MTILTETCDFRRFGSARGYMAFTGLVPREHSSGAMRRQGSITKAGNAHLRRVLIEAAWAYRHRPAVRGKLAVRQEGLPPELLAYSWQAQVRLHGTYRKLAARRGANKAAVAVARELSGFAWRAMTERTGAGCKARERCEQAASCDSGAILECVMRRRSGMRVPSGRQAPVRPQDVRSRSADISMVERRSHVPPARSVPWPKEGAVGPGR